ncbi:unnamed protein product [Sympodiomycopsis kandeliae]
MALNASDQTDGQPSLSIHRLRFLPFSPSAPTSLALSPHPVGATGRSLLAIGRQNGNIDLCTWVAGVEGSVAKGWVNQTTLVSRSGTSKKIESLSFAQTTGENYGPDRLRLFSISGGSVLTEHTLPYEFTFPGKVFSHQAKFEASQQVVGTTRTLTSGGGVIWCMAVSPLSRYIAVGCEDGHVRIIDIRQGRFEHLALSNAAKGGVGEAVPRMDRAKTRIVSLAWGASLEKPRQQKSQPFRRASKPNQSDSSDSDSDDDEEDNWTESYILAGTTSSSALLFTLSTGRLNQKLLLPKARNEQTIVWSVTVLPDQTLVTGDSLGFVTFYDAATKVPLPEGRFQVHDKGADVLCLTVGSDGKTVYSGSVDQKVSEFALLGKKWAHTATRRLHAHDVKAVVIDPPRGPKTKGPGKLDGNVPVLVSASADFNIVLTPASPPSEINARLHRRKQDRNGKGVASAIENADQNPVSSNPMTTFGSTTQRRIPYVPASNAGSAFAGNGAGSIRVCAARGWIVMRSEKAIEIWEVQNQAAQPLNQGPLAGPSQNAAPYRRLLQMVMGKERSRLISHAISADGQYLAISDMSETRVFSLRVSLGELTPKIVKTFSRLLVTTPVPPSSAMTFTPDGRLIMAGWPNMTVRVVIINPEGLCQVIKNWTIGTGITGKRAVAGRGASRSADAGHASNGSSKNGQEEEVEVDEDEDEDEEDGYSSDGLTRTEMTHKNDAVIEKECREANKHRIDHLVVSADSQYLLCSSNSHIWTYNLDLMPKYAKLLPSLSSKPVGLAFHPANSNIAATALQDGSVKIFQLEEEGGNSNERWNSLSSEIQAKISGVRDHPTGITWMNNSSTGPLLVINGSTWLLTARENPNSTFSHGATTGTKRRTRNSIHVAEEEASSNWIIKLTFRYQPLVYVASLDPVNVNSEGQGEETTTTSLAVIERPFFELAGNLKGVWKREKRYGQ